MQALKEDLLELTADAGTVTLLGCLLRSPDASLSRLNCTGRLAWLGSVAGTAAAAAAFEFKLACRAGAAVPAALGLDCMSPLAAWPLLLTRLDRREGVWLAAFGANETASAS